MQGCKQTTSWMDTTGLWPAKHSNQNLQQCTATVHCTNWVVWPNSSVMSHTTSWTMAVWQPPRFCVCYFKKTKYPHEDLMHPLLKVQFFLHPLSLYFVVFFFICMPYFLPSDASVSSAIPCSSHHPSPLASPRHLFHSAAINTRCCTEVSVPSVSSWQPQPHWQECISSLWPHFAKSGWVRAACRNSCWGSDQKKERDFFDC